MPAGGIWNTLSSSKEPLVISNYSREMRELFQKQMKNYSGLVVRRLGFQLQLLTFAVS